MNKLQKKSYFTDILGTFIEKIRDLDLEKNYRYTFVKEMLIIKTL